MTAYGGTRRIGGFRVVSQVRCGADGRQGVVLEAVCEEPTVAGVSPGERVALKTMHAPPVPSPEADAAWAEFSERTAALAALAHPNIVRYRGCFREKGPFSDAFVVVMELLDGETLRERLDASHGGLDAEDAMTIAAGALAGLAAASSAGIVHRDVKPANIFICRDGTVKLIDFEISRREAAVVEGKSGRFEGSLDYMAPELAIGVSGRGAASDVFSMGVVLHEMLAGRLPYASAGGGREGSAEFRFLERWRKREDGASPVRISSAVSAVLSGADAVLAKAMAEDPDARYPDAAAFLEGLRGARYRDLRSEATGGIYRLEREVGRGGFGAVFKARVRGTGEAVAVKRLLKYEYAARFRREARAMRRLQGSAFAKFVDYFEIDSPGGREAFIVMSFLPGMPGLSLRDAVRNRAKSPMPEREVLAAFARYAEALETMHAAGIFHRDIKPSNLYCPPGRPGDAAIMDFGIVRDIHGTRTSDGSVPGTLDYMPPEVVFGESRGDASEDVYALGLCLCEALSGRKAYPRLPSGPDAIQAFIERVQSGRKPDFSAPETSSDPRILRLLEDMTALDPGKRISSAATVRRRIVAILAEPRESVAQLAGGESDTIAPVPSSAPSGVGAARRGVSSHTPAPARPSRPARRRTSLPLRYFVLPAVLILLAFGVRLAWSPVRESFLVWREKAAARRIRELEETEKRRREAVEREAAERKAAAEREEAERKAAAEREKVKRREELARIEAELKKKEAERKAAAEREAAERARREAEAAAKAERERLENEKRERIRIRAAAAKPACEAAAKAVAGRFADPACGVNGAEKAAADWRNEFSEWRDEPFYKDAAREIAKAREERSAADAAGRTVADCRRWISAIASVTPGTVANWRSNIDNASLELERAVRDGKIGGEAAAALRGEIAAASAWSVGIVWNRLHHAVAFAGADIPATAWKVFVMKDGFRDGAAVEAEGCEPLPVARADFDSKVFDVVRLEARRSGSAAVVPEYVEGLACTVDGVARAPGRFELRPGQHDAVWRNLAETRPGVRDFEDFKVSFHAPPGGVAQVPPPPGEWKRTAAFETAAASAAAAEKARAIEARVLRLLAPEPIAGRRERLKKAYALLNDWRTPEAMSALGPGALGALDAKYKAEEALVRGTVRNDTSVAVSVETSLGRLEVPPGEERTATFSGATPYGARVKIEAPGHEFLFMPCSRESFDGKTFAIEPSALTPLPVRIVAPSAEDGAVLAVQAGDAETVLRPGESLELRPGIYRAEWRRPDYATQRLELRITPQTAAAPPPREWKPGSALGAFSEAMQRFAAGAADLTKDAIDRIGTIEDPARRKQLEDLRRAVELRESLAEPAHAR